MRELAGASRIAPRELRELSIDDAHDPPWRQAARLVHRLEPEPVSEGHETIGGLPQVEPWPRLAPPRRVAERAVDGPAPHLVVLPVLGGKRGAGPCDPPERQPDVPLLPRRAGQRQALHEHRP